MIRSIAHDQPQKNFKYLWLDFGLPEKESETRFEEIIFTRLIPPIENRQSKIENVT